MATVSIKAQKTETDVAVLQVKVQNIEERLDDLKTDIRGIKDALDDHAEKNVKLITSLKDSNDLAHKNMHDKISNLEKWRWMLMGAGVVIGSLGYDMIGQLLTKTM